MSFAPNIGSRVGRGRKNQNVNLASSTILTGESTASGTFVDLATVGPRVTIRTGTSALIIIGAKIRRNISTPNQTGWMGFAVSGATTIVADTNYAASLDGMPNQQGVSAQFTTLLTNLTPGVNTFTAKYTTTGGATFIYASRSLTVIPVQ